MKKLISVFLALFLLCSLLGTAASADYAEELPGSYTLVDLTGTDNEMQDALAMLNALGMSATLEIAEDGSAVMNLFFTEIELQFDFDKGTVKSEDETMTFKVEGEKLIFGTEENAFVFTKGEPTVEVDPMAGPFRCYAITDLQNEAGETVGEALNEKGEPNVTLLLVDAGGGTMTYGGNELALSVDFEAMTINDGEKDYSFTIDGTELKLFADEAIMVFEQTDPGCYGPYELTGFGGEEMEELDEQLATLKAMHMVPKMELAEDGTGVMSLMGEEMVMHFDFDSMTVTSEDQEGEVSFTYENGVLTMGNGEEVMIFSRVMPEAEADAE